MGRFLDQLEQNEKYLRDEYIRSLKRYEQFLNQRLDVYRAQRAWRVMVFLRKLYTLLVREAPSHPIKAAQKLFSEPLSNYEIELPRVWDFLPAGGAVAQSGPPHLARYPLIVMPVFDFEGRFARPQQIALQFAANGHPVYWISPVRKPGPGVTSGYEISELRSNVYEVRLDAPAFHLNLGELTPALLDAIAHPLERMIHELDIHECWLLLQYPFWRKLALRLRHGFGFRIAYDCMDDHQNWPLEPKPSQANKADERRLFSEADLVTVTAGGLARQAGRFGANPVLVPNGADSALYESAGSESQVSELPRPIIGFIGGVEEWFDSEAVAYCAAQRPEYSFVIAGRIGKGADRATLQSQSNIHLLGEVKYPLLPSIQRNFDVCLIPFKLHPLMEFANQVKLYEYFSQGKPVVSSRLPELQAPEDLIYFAGTKEEYLAQIDAAIAESGTAAGSEFVRRRLEFARQTNWAARTAAIHQAIRARTPLVSVIVLTHNSERYLPSFHRYFLKNTAWPNYELIYADNASGDGTRTLIESYAGGRVRAVCFDTNTGFAAGNNAAARLAQGSFLIFLNPDTIVTRGWVGKLIHALESHPNAGLAAPVTNFSGKRNRIEPLYSNCGGMEAFAARLAREKRGETMEIPAAPMLCAALGRSTWEKTGELDERFGAGMFEDDDYCLRLRQAGLRVVTAEDCFIHHFGSGSFSQLGEAALSRVFNANRELFEAKWGVKWQPDEMRPGVAAPEAARIFDPASFFLDD